MPAGATAKGPSPSNRTTFRPPWVKEGAEVTDPLNPFNLKSVPKKQESPPSDSGDGNNNPIAKVKLRKVPVKEVKIEEDSDDSDEITIPEKEKLLEGVQLRKVKKKEPLERESFRKEKENNPLAGVKLRKISVQTKEPQQNDEEKESFFVKPQLKPVPQREKSPPKKDHKIHDLPNLKKVEERKLPERKPSMLRRDSTIEDMEIDRELPAKRNSLVRAESIRRLSHTPAPPPMPPAPPPPPGMPGEANKKPLTSKQAKKLELLKSRPKVRPDWSATLKEIESGRKLKHVECNDRSQPLLPEAKTQEHFLYDSEKPNVHNELLKQIEGGIKLKKVQTNDRSKPVLDGLRKFRRQMTIEEQIQKSMSMASIPPVSDEVAPEEVDELDDIDKVRDDLQSTKQMLALELRNKEAQEMENKRLLARLANLEAELEKAKAGGGTNKANSADDKVIQSLKKEAEQSRKNSEQIEKKYTEAMKSLDTTKLQLEDYKRKNIELEKKLLDALGGKRVSISNSRQNSVPNEDDDFGDDETEEESDGEDTPEKREKKLQKEVKQLGNKLRNFKVKVDNAKKERIALKEIIKKNQTAIKEEKKRYNKIKKEVDKMEALLKDVSEDDDEDEEKEEEEEEEVEEEESSEESESESDSDDSDSEKSLSEPEDAPLDKKKTNLSSRSKRHEARLGALKKGNFLLKTNAERLQDDLNRQKEMTQSLQEELDSVLSELG